MVPLFAGVIIAGLGIGALLSAFAARHSPAPAQSRAPLVVEHTPTPIASLAQRTVLPSAVQSPSPPVTDTPTPRVTRTPSPSSTATATARTAPSVAPTASITHTPRIVAVATPRVSLAPTSAPPAAQTSPAETLVRHYLDALARGDYSAASVALGGGTASSDEMKYADPTMSITSLSTKQNSAGGTEVQAEFRTAHGDYFGSFTVDASGTRITQHEVIPVGGTTAR
jgi:hypothetical protein